MSNRFLLSYYFRLMWRLTANHRFLWIWHSLYYRICAVNWAISLINPAFVVTVNASREREVLWWFELFMKLHFRHLQLSYLLCTYNISGGWMIVVFWGIDQSSSEQYWSAKQVACLYCFLTSVLLIVAKHLEARSAFCISDLKTKDNIDISW